MFFIVIGIIAPIVFIIYNIVCYKKSKVIYTIKGDDFQVINKDFYKLQLGLSFINCLCITISAYITQKEFIYFGWLLVLVAFWGINYLIKFIAIAKGYARK